jgi:hypothetical protein
MISNEVRNDIFAIVHNIRDSILDNETLGALSLANYLYFKILRLTVEELKDKEVADEGL